MAEERTLGTARATEPVNEELSKEELQRRMEEARDSISHTVTEIKETVVNQYQAVKDTLDWREQFRRRPVEWSAGAVGVGFLVGYGVAAIVKGDSNGYTQDSGFAPASHSYSSQPVLGQAASMRSETYAPSVSGTTDYEDEGPGLLQRLKTTPAYDRVKGEVADIGNSVLDELSKTAKTVLVPAVLKSIKDFIGGYLPLNAMSESTAANRGSSPPRSKSESSYQPVLERDSV